MNIEELIHDLRARINPQYYDQLGTESYERHQVVKALEYLATENERLKELMAKRTREHQQEMTSFRLRVRSQDDATFAALREENERLRENAKIISELEQLAARSNNDLLVENERLRKDADRIDWLSHQDFDALCLSLVIDAPHCGEYYVCGDNNDDGYGSTFREAIDAARGVK